MGRRARGASRRRPRQARESFKITRERHAGDNAGRRRRKEIKIACCGRVASWSTVGGTFRQQRGDYLRMVVQHIVCVCECVCYIVSIYFIVACCRWKQAAAPAAFSEFPLCLKTHTHTHNIRMPHMAHDIWPRGAGLAGKLSSPTFDTRHALAFQRAHASDLHMPNLRPRSHTHAQVHLRLQLLCLCCSHT